MTANAPRKRKEFCKRGHPQGPGSRYRGGDCKRCNTDVYSATAKHQAKYAEHLDDSVIAVDAEVEVPGWEIDVLERGEW